MNLLSRFQLPSFHGLEGVLKIFSQRITDFENLLKTKVFIEHPGLHRVCLRP